MLFSVTSKRNSRIKKKAFNTITFYYSVRNTRFKINALYSPFTLAKVNHALRLPQITFIDHSEREKKRLLLN